MVMSRDLNLANVRVTAGATKRLPKPRVCGDLARSPHPGGFQVEVATGASVGLGLEQNARALHTVFSFGFMTD